MADTVTKIIDCFASSGYDPATKTTPVIETIKVEFDASGTTKALVLNSATAASIETRLVREAFAVFATPCNATAGTAATLHVAISTTTYANDTVTLTGVASGAWYVQIVGRA